MKLFKYTIVTLCLLLSPALAEDVIFADSFETCTLTLDERITLLEQDYVSKNEYRALRRWVKHMQDDVNMLKEYHDE